MSVIARYSVMYGRFRSPAGRNMFLVCVLSDMPVLWRTCCAVDQYAALLSHAFASVLNNY